MANLYVNEVTVGGVTVLNLKSDTISVATLQSGVTAHDRSGAPITGTLSVPVVQASKSYESSINGTFTISPDSGYDGMAAVSLTVAIPSYTDLS